MSPSGEIPTLGENSLASQHPTDHPLHPATPIVNITSTTCSPWILYTPLARDSPSSDSVGCKSFPSWGFLLPWGTFPFHPTSHPLPPVTPVLDITSTTCPPWLLHTLFARNPSSSASVLSKQIPPRPIFPHRGTFPLHPTSHLLPPLTPV